MAAQDRIRLTGLLREGPSGTGALPIGPSSTPFAPRRGRATHLEVCRVDHLRVELAPAERADLVQRVLDRPYALVGTLGDERVEDVADRGDAPGERDRLAGEAGRIAGAVPVLVVRACDDLAELHDR